jgi:hypothetical protein
VVETIVQANAWDDLPFLILETAETEKVSLIMTAAGENNTDTTILTGSVSGNAIRNAKIPVLLIRFLPGSGATDDRRNFFPAYWYRGNS